MSKSQGGNTKRLKTPAQKAAQHSRTAKNKCRAVRRALVGAKGKYKTFLEGRLLYWVKGGKAA